LFRPAIRLNLLGFIDKFGLGNEIACHRDQSGSSFSIVKGRGEPKAVVACRRRYSELTIKEKFRL
jgi:hypothetical protein